MNATISTASPQAVFERKRRGDTIHLVDVRTPGEFDALHADGARLVPLERIQSENVDASLTLGHEGVGTTEPLYLVCLSGVRASQAAERLVSRGFTNVHVVDGGTEGWAKSGLPVVKGKGVISIERQVQIAIGMVVILKVVFGFALSPVFFGFVALLGGGLIFAGVTQNCALAKLIARLPWNQSRSCEIRQPA